MSPIQHGTTRTAIHPIRQRGRRSTLRIAPAGVAALLLWTAAGLSVPAEAADAAAAAAAARRPAKPAGATQAHPGKATPAPAPAGFTLGAPPAWVEPVAVEPAPAALPMAPVQVLLVDRQVRLTGQGTSAGMHRFERWIRQINEAAGLETASRVEIEFDPSTQRLQWHALALWRGGQRIDKAHRNFKRSVESLESPTQPWVGSRCLPGWLGTGAWAVALSGLGPP